MRKLAAQPDASQNASKCAVLWLNTAPFCPESLRRFYGVPESPTEAVQFWFDLAGKGGDFARFAEVQGLLQMVKTDTSPISSGGATGPTHLIASTNTATASAAAATESTATENPRFSVNELVESVFKIFSI